MASNDVYSMIAKTFEFPGSKNLIKYLKVLFTPEEGELLMEILAPVTCKQLAERLKVDEKSLSEKLEDFKRRRLLFKKKDEYLFHRWDDNVRFFKLLKCNPGWFRKGLQHPGQTAGHRHHASPGTQRLDSPATGG